MQSRAERQCRGITGHSSVTAMNVRKGPELPSTPREMFRAA